MGSEFRQIEYQSSLRFPASLPNKKPSTQREHEIWCVAHDVATPISDRRFRELYAFLATVKLRDEGDAIRSFDIEQWEGETRAQAHVSGAAL